MSELQGNREDRSCGARERAGVGDPLVMRRWGTREATVYVTKEQMERGKEGVRKWTLRRAVPED